MTREEAQDVVTAASRAGALPDSLAIAGSEQRWIELRKDGAVIDVLVWVVSARQPARTSSIEIAIDERGEVVRVEEFR